MSEKPLTPEEERAKEKAKSALTDAIAAVDSPQKAEQVISELEARAGAAKEVEVAEQTPTPDSARAAASALQQAAKAPPEQKPQEVIVRTAEEIAAADQQDEQVIAEAVREVVNPEAAAEQTKLRAQ